MSAIAFLVHLKFLNERTGSGMPCHNMYALYLQEQVQPVQPYRLDKDRWCEHQGRDRFLPGQAPGLCVQGQDPEEGLSLQGYVGPRHTGTRFYRHCPRQVQEEPAAQGHCELGGKFVVLCLTSDEDNEIQQSSFSLEMERCVP